MMPKLIALARRRVIGSMPSIGTPNTSLAVRAWMSSPLAKLSSQHRQVGDVGQQPQLDLRVVGADQHMARFGNERVADAAAFLGADRDVLQVRIGRGQPPGRGDRHGEAGMHPPGLGIDVGDQRVGIGRFQLLQLPPFQDAVRQLHAPGRPAFAAPRNRSPRRRSSSACRRAVSVRRTAPRPAASGCRR